MNWILQRMAITAFTLVVVCAATLRDCAASDTGRNGLSSAHWSYQPVLRPAVPKVDSPWPTNPIDRFVISRLSAQRLSPSPSARPANLLRRLSFDVIGLPPSYDDVSSFELDNRPDAYELAVERLLASEHYGERMAMYWLDLVRYADTVGYHGDQEISVSPYRDYVIEAFNDNMPFDQFTVEQFAGDLLPNPSNDQLIASGYNRLGMMSAEGGVQPKEYLTKYAAERVRNASLVWMGSTLGCAECHNHKYDPFTTKDFYRFASFFADIKEQGIYAGANASGHWGPVIELPTPEQTEQLQQLDQEIAMIKAQLADAEESAKPAPAQGDDSDQSTSDSEQAKQNVETIKKKLKETEKRRADVQRGVLTSHITVAVDPRTMRVLPRGNWMDDSGEIVSPAVPAFLPRIDTGDWATRLDLAKWLVAEQNPLTARVFVNRLWYMYFGRGLVATLDDFGTMGAQPSHPELLDWLAAEFVDSGWDIKHVVRLIVTSATYRQSSFADAAARTDDPYNELLARQGRYRLNAEMIRDNALAASGLLVRKIGGRSVKPYQPKGYYAHLNFPRREYQHSKGDALWRRSLYTHWQRQFLHPSLMAFDAPSREEACIRRPRSNTPLAALVLLNDPIYVEAARAFGERILNESLKDDDARIIFAFRHTLQRDPRGDELALLRQVVEKQREQFRRSQDQAAKLTTVGEDPVEEQMNHAELAAWANAARVLINTHEFITRN